MADAVRDIWPLLWARNLSDSLAFYTDSLGFDLVGSAEQDGAMYWCQVRRGPVSLMLQQADPDAEMPAPLDELYIICEDADAMYEELRGRGVDVRPPTVAEYGMKQLFVPEPDGRVLVFESPTEDWVL